MMWSHHRSGTSKFEDNLDTSWMMAKTDEPNVRA